MNRVLLLDQQRIDRKLQRMAFQIWEQHSDAPALTLVGIEHGGLVVATQLADRLRQISGIDVQLLPLKMNKRDVLATPGAALENLTGRHVVLVDDVANSGKTLLYALRPLMAYELASILVAVLVDRKHKSFPVCPDIIGHAVATTLQENIVVETEGGIVTAAYLE